METSLPKGVQQAPRARTTCKELAMICWGLVLIGFVAPFLIVTLSHHSPPDGDFAGFYSLGRILNEFPARELYNTALQQQMCMQVHPRKFAYGPLPYPPMVGIFFRPFALLPYWSAYLLWSVITIILYALGIRFLLRSVDATTQECQPLVYSLAFAYLPFLMNTAANGQIAAVGFFALSMALYAFRQKQPMRSGLVLSLCTYKPTLLVLLLPMLVVTRLWKVLAGFAVGAAALAVIATLLEGIGIWPIFLHSLLSFGKVASGVHSASPLTLTIYLDLSSFSHLVRGGRTVWGLAILAALVCWVLFNLLRLWWKAPRRNRQFHMMLWATTVTWTLLLNLYVPIYDSILVVFSILVTAGAIKELDKGPIHRWFHATWILILLGSWVTVALAGVTGIQLLTLLIAALGALQFVVLGRLAKRGAPAMESGVA